MPKGLFAVAPAPPEDDDDLEDLDDFAGDLELDDDEPEASMGGGPFDEYAAIVFDADTDPLGKADALRQAIETVLEERGGRR